MLAKLIVLVIPLGLDTLAVAVAVGIAGLVTGRRMRVSLLMTGFEAGMPLVGLALGVPLGHALGGAADYVAIGVLLSFGIFMLLADDDGQERVGRLGDLSGWREVLVGLSVSLDELAIGFTFGLLHLPVIPVIVLIAVQTFVISQLGMRLGARVSEQFRERAEQLAGLTLASLAIVLLIQKLAS